MNDSNLFVRSSVRSKSGFKKIDQLKEYLAKDSYSTVYGLNVKILKTIRYEVRLDQIR